MKGVEGQFMAIYSDKRT